MQDKLYQALNNQEQVQRIDSFVTDNSMQGLDVKNRLQKIVEQQENLAQSALEKQQDSNKISRDNTPTANERVSLMATLG